MAQQFVYTSDGYTYTLKPIFRFSENKFLRVRGAELYGRRNGRYYGYWERSNMPLTLVRSLESYCRIAYAHGNYEKDDQGNYKPTMD